LYAYRANRAQMLAERRLEALHRLTNSMLFEVDDALVTLQGATAARAAIVNRTLQYLDQMSADSGNSAEVLRDLASAYTRVAKIQSAEQTAHLGGSGSLIAGRISLEKARAILQRLAASDPRNATLQLEVLGAQLNIAETYRYEGNLDRALAMHVAGAAQAEALASRTRGSDPALTEAQYVLSAFLTACGTESGLEGDSARAVDYDRRAAALRLSLLATHPGDPRAMRVAGIAHNYLSMGLASAGMYDEAADEERKALAVWEPMAAASPRNVELRGMVGDANENLCKDLMHQRKYPEATRRCREAAALFQSAADGDPNNVQAQEDLATAFSAMSDLLDASGDAAHALAWEKRARALYASIAVNDADSLEAATANASSLLHLGVLESRLGERVAGTRDLRESQNMLGRQLRQSPKNHRIAGLLQEASVALEKN
jgi:tetratricopeptide (TPR) repeat protein